VLLCRTHSPLRVPSQTRLSFHPIKAQPGQRLSSKWEQCAIGGDLTPPPHHPQIPPQQQNSLGLSTTRNCGLNWQILTAAVSALGSVQSWVHDPWPRMPKCTHMRQLEPLSPSQNGAASTQQSRQPSPCLLLPPCQTRSHHLRLLTSPLSRGTQPVHGHINLLLPLPLPLPPWKPPTTCTPALHLLPHLLLCGTPFTLGTTAHTLDTGLMGILPPNRTKFFFLVFIYLVFEQFPISIVVVQYYLRYLRYQSIYSLYPSHLHDWELSTKYSVYTLHCTCLHPSVLKFTPSAVLVSTLLSSSPHSPLHLSPPFSPQAYTLHHTCLHPSVLQPLPFTVLVSAPLSSSLCSHLALLSPPWPPPHL
jgi:hypothetical protein